MWRLGKKSFDTLKDVACRCQKILRFLSSQVRVPTIGGHDVDANDPIVPEQIRAVTFDF